MPDILGAASPVVPGGAVPVSDVECRSRSDRQHQNERPDQIDDSTETHGLAPQIPVISGYPAMPHILAHRDCAVSANRHSRQTAPLP